jgi:ankyrin repeat protein
VLALIDKGARLDEKDSDGKTALISAIEKDQKDIALALIDKGANLDEKDATGWTALFWAAYNGQKDIVLILIKNGADVSLITNRGDSALSIARAQGHTEIADAISVARAKQSLPSEAAPSDFFKAERPAVPLAADESHAGARVRSAWL